MNEATVNISELRKIHRLSQAEMAQRLGISRQYYNALECGHRHPGKLLNRSMLTLVGELSSARSGIVDKIDSSVRLYADSANGVGNKPRIAGRNEVQAYMAPWLAKIDEDENVAPYILTQLRKHLPHDDLTLFGKKLSH